jgi:hypothetical protein
VSRFPSTEKDITFPRVASSSGIVPLRLLNAISITCKKNTTYQTCDFTT